MFKRIVSGIMLTLLLISTLTLAVRVQPVEASGTIYVRADGSIDPPTAPISTVDNVTYTFTDNIFNSIVVERDNIVIDGNKYVLQGPADGTGIGCEAFRNNVTIQNMFITNFPFGIRFYSSSGTVIKNVTVTLCDTGIWLAWGSNANVTENIVRNNKDGIDVAPCSGVVARNIIAYNINGLLIADVDVIGNKIINNSIGITAINTPTTRRWTDNHIINNFKAVYGGYLYCNIYHNNFINNTMVADLFYSTVTWDDGYPSGGNYWSDYNGTDLYSGPYQNETESDGIGDTPYVIDANNQDRYPLMNPWLRRDIAIVNVSSFKTVVGQGYSTSINVTLENQGETAETFDVTLYADSGQVINETGLVGYWKFDEGTGTTAYDSSGNGNDGTLMNGPAWVGGKYGSALNFDGSDDFVRVPDSTSISSPSVTRAITVMAWVKPDPGFLDRWARIVASHWTDGEGQVGGSSNAWVLEARNYDTRYHSLIGAGDDVTFVDLPSNTPVQEGAWQHVAFTWNGSIVTFYFNGVVDATATYTGGLSDSSRPMQIGKNIIDFVWKGLIDEVKVYNRSLSATEIWTEYTSTRIAIQTQTVTLESGASQTLTFTWNTTGWPKGNYTLSAYAEPVLGEIDTEDNYKEYGLIKVSVIGDINGDFKVDIKDLVLVIKHFATYPGHPNWKPEADVNGDGKVDIKDLVLVIKHFGEHYP